jgi:hypothetical protein
MIESFTGEICQRATSLYLHVCLEKAVLKNPDKVSSLAFIFTSKRTGKGAG